MTDLFDGCWGCAVILGALVIGAVVLGIGASYGPIGLIVGIAMLIFFFGWNKR